MKKLNFLALLLCAAIVIWGCGANNTVKGGLIGGGSGAALGGVIGGIAGKGKGAAIGAAVGTAVGATAGVIIGKKMDKAAEQVREEIGDDAQVEEVVDNNGLQAVKVTFDSGILFGFNSSDLNSASQASLTKLANVLKEYPTMDIAIYGHTDKVGTYEANQTVSTRRAQAVENYLRQRGVSGAQFKYVEGKGYAEYNEALPAAQNRRVEIFMYASEQMIKEAEAEIG